MIYWCNKCEEPVFDKKLHELSCNGKMRKLSEGSICNPVFIQERKLLSKIIGMDLTDKKIWYFGSSRYLFDGEVQRIPYLEWYKQKEGSSLFRVGNCIISLRNFFAPVHSLPSEIMTS